MPASRTIVTLVFAVTAPFVAAGREPSPPAAAEPADPKFKAEQLEHWAFQPIAETKPPKVKHPELIKNGIDAFIISALEQVDLMPAPEADRETLCRRLTFDLTGLPPTPDELRGFLADRGPDAYERLVDRLLASPQFGVRWAQHWLDLAHYADTNGFEIDADRPDAWRYRDWVVDAINSDMPFDRFVELQIAGDEIAPGDPSALVATGFARCGPRELVSGNINQFAKRQNELAEINGTVGSVFLGLTMTCARCHDHKFDPLPSADYYRLQAYFAAAEPAEKPMASAGEDAIGEATKKEFEARLAQLSKSLEGLEAPIRAAIKREKDALLTPAERTLLAIPVKDRTSAQKKMISGIMNSLRVTWEDVAAAAAKDSNVHEEREKLKRAIHELKLASPRPPAKAMALASPDAAAEAPKTFVLKRGDAEQKGAEVEPRPPGILLASTRSETRIDANDAGPQGRGRRTKLARWLTSKQNPLVARVIVNRLWQHHFGKGLVATPNDFGARGEPPSHPELLDWLANRLVRDGWTLKPMHKLMLMSATYRQSSRVQDQKAEDLDPENLLLRRMNRRRLDAEEIRDAMIASSGEINLELGGAPTRGYLEPEVKRLIFTEEEVVDIWPLDQSPRALARRSLYLYRKRNVRYSLFNAFDAPDTQSPCAARSQSTHALQALNLLNSDFACDRARALAGRVLGEADPDDAARVRRLYRICLSRNPDPAELARALQFLIDQPERIGPRANDRLAIPTFAPATITDQQAAAWTDLAIAIINSAEFIHIW